MDIRNIRHKDGKTEIVFRRPNGNGFEDTVFPSTDEPQKPFRDAMAALSNDLLKLLDLPAEEKKRVEATGVAIGEKKGVRHFIISGRRTIESGPHAISTPLHWEREDDTGANTCPAATVEIIDKLIKAAGAFVSGKRKQTDVFEDEPAEAGAEK